MSTNTEIVQVRMPAPDFTLKNLKGAPITLSSYQGKENVVLFFFRYFMWLQCQDFARQLVGASEEFQKRNTRVFLVGRDRRQFAENMARIVKADPAQVLLDESGVVYDAYALEKKFLSLIQESAAYVINKQGTLEFAYVVTNPLVWLRKEPARQLFAALDALPKD